MPIFSKDKEVLTEGAIEGFDKSVKMKELMKKLKEEKTTIKEVFYAVDNEGDSDGMISFDEF